MSASDPKKRRRGLGKPSPGPEHAPALPDVASSLEAEVSRLESITGRVARLDLNAERSIQRAAELLKEAAESHERFLAHLRALVESVESAKQRHNQAADTLSRCASLLEERRREYGAFHERFAALAGETREVVGLMQRGSDVAGADLDAATALERLRVAGLRLTAAAEAARALGTDARQANFIDLEREADAIWQQLHALSKKLQRTGQALGPTSGGRHA